MDMNQLLQTTLLGYSLKDYANTLAILVGSFLLIFIIKQVIIKRLEILAERTKTKADDIAVKIIDSIGWLFYFAIAFRIAIKTLGVPDNIIKASNIAVLIIATFYTLRAITFGIKLTKRRIAEKRKEKDSTQLDLLSIIASIIVWIIGVIILLSSLGVNVTSLLAGLGIGGIAIAFALQNVLSDIFASFSIYLDKPFKKGDFIIIGDDMGTIEKIGIKSTRIKTLHGQMLVVSNQELTSTRVNNYARMERRRVVITLGVTYQTKTAKLKKIPAMIKNIVDKTEHAEFDRCHFKTYGDFNLQIELVYYIDDKDYSIYMDVNQEINLKIKEAFEKEKIEFAYPTQTVFVEK